MFLGSLIWVLLRFVGLVDHVLVLLRWWLIIFFNNCILQSLFNLFSCTLLVHLLQQQTIAVFVDDNFWFLIGLGLNYLFKENFLRFFFIQVLLNEFVRLNDIWYLVQLLLDVVFSQVSKEILPHLLYAGQHSIQVFVVFVLFHKEVFR